MKEWGSRLEGAWDQRRQQRRAGLVSDKNNSIDRLWVKRCKKVTVILDYDYAPLVNYC